MTDARVTVGAPPWRAVELGVAPHGTAGRLMLAWARQAPAMLTDSARGFDWHLTPSGRSDAVLPMFEWLPARLVMVDRRPTWLVHGMLRIHAMPLSTRALWHGRTVAGMMPAVVSVIDLATGAMQFYLDPAADSLARAWARVVGPLIASSRALPQAVRTADGYDADWLDAQLSVLSGPVWNDGRQLRRLAGREDIVPVWTDGGNAAWQGALLAPTSDDALAAVATAFRADGAPVLALVSPPLPSDGAAASQPGELHRLWNAAAPVRHLRDSTRAAGDTVGWAGMRWRSRGNALAAWDALYALSRHRPPSLLWLATAVDDRVGGGRRPQGAWADETAARTPAANVVSDPGVVLEQARQWVQRADSALSRGDLAAFARAFDQVRRLLGPASDSLDH